MTTGNDPYLDHLRGQLTAVIDDLRPPAAPTALIKQRGKSIRNRRRAGVAAGLIVAIVAAALVPGLLHQLRAPTPVAPPQKNLQVKAFIVGKHAPRGLIATGAIDGKTWRISVSRQGKDICLTSSGTVAQAGCTPVGDYAAGQPATLDGVGGGPISTLYGIVSSQVALVNLDLSDGSVLNLHPVRFDGRLWIAAELPGRLTVTRVVAYSLFHEIAYAIPFYSAPGGLPSVEAWLRPGQPVPPEFVRLIASGVTAGKRWSVTLHAGPWGQCIVPAIPGDGGNTGCWATDTNQPGLIMGSGGPGTNQSWYVAEAPANVSYLVLSMTDGSTRRVPIAQIGHDHLYAIVILGGPHIASWAAYNSSGHRQYGGRGDPTFGRS